jgi:hypothetical protein
MISRPLDTFFPIRCYSFPILKIKRTVKKPDIATPYPAKQAINYICDNPKLFSMRCLKFTGLIIGIFAFVAVRAQDYSNKGLMDIKEKVEANRVTWNKAFDDASAAKNFAALRPLREADERYVDEQISALRRLYAEGDGRALLSAINNYLRIQKQFIRDIMLPAESIEGNDADIATINEKISSFGEKEKIFLVEINNALRTEGAEAGPSTPAKVDEEMEEDNLFEEPHGSVIEGRETRKEKRRLPHEKARHKKHKDRDSQAEDEE